MLRRTADAFRDLFGGGFGVNMGIGDEERPVLKDHERERTDGMVFLGPAAKDFLHVFQVPQVLPEGAADQAVGFAAMHHDPADGGCVGAHDGAGDVGVTPRRAMMAW